jgi:hypothetical protein
MKDDTVRRLQALEEEYSVTADGQRDVVFDELFADPAALEAVRGDAA